MSEVSVAPLKEVVRVLQEKLQVILKDAKTTAEFGRLRCCRLVAADMLGQIHQGLPGYPEHLFSILLRYQVGFGFRESLTPFAICARIDRVSYAQLQYLPDIKLAFTQNLPDVTSLLAGNCSERIKAERSTFQRFLDLSMELLLEPKNVFFIGHIALN